MKNLNIFFTISALFISGFLSAQCMLLHSSLEDRIDSSAFVCEARVISQTSFWGADSMMIYTDNLVEIYKVFKGPGVVNTVHIITVGGTIDSVKIIANPGLRLDVGQIGVFMLGNYKGGQFQQSLTPQGWPIAEDASFLPYGANYLAAKDVFEEDEIDRYDLYDRIEGITGQTMTEVSELPIPNAGDVVQIISILAISPTTVQAGVEDVLTITGIGFGNTPGTVFFDNPNDGSGGSYTSALPFHIQSWTNTEIKVYVPSGAGSGKIFVRTADGTDSGLSLQTINVEYNISNVNSGGSAFRTYLIDDECDDNGGYQFRYSTNTANGGVNFFSAASGQAAGSFERALQSWQGIGYAAFAGDGCGITSVQMPGSDGVNIISFDSNVWDLDNEASPSTLGVAYSQFSKCGSSEWEVVGMDIIFRRNGQGVNWEFGGPAGNTQPSPGEIDFETVALHEIGHTHQLGHVIDSEAVMHYQVSAGGSNRTLGPEDINGANDVENVSLAYNPPIINCGGDFNCERDYMTYIFGNDCAVMALPVELLSFDGYTSKQEVILNWSASSETNNDFYTLERSFDNNKFEPIAVIEGAGNSFQRTDYKFIDRTPAIGFNYYRLSQTDFDGKTNYVEKVIVIEFVKDNHFSVFPNPVTKNSMQIALSANVAGGLDLQIFDASGQMVYTNGYSVGKGLNYVEVSLPELQAGIYMLRINQNGMLNSQRFVLSKNK